MTVVKRGRGRPLGSKNKFSNELEKLLADQEKNVKKPYIDNKVRLIVLHSTLPYRMNTVIKCFLLFGRCVISHTG